MKKTDAEILAWAVEQGGARPTPTPGKPVVEEWEPDHPRAVDPAERINWQRAESDSQYFQKIRADGRWAAAHAARAEKNAREKRAAELAEHQERLRLKLESIDRARDAERAAQEERRAADALKTTNEWRKSGGLTPIDAKGDPIY